ncbi:transcription initiation factor IID, 18kD subunit-domain-containing protein [Mycena maculata]|uniref:Transcription initiation factor TFIID subunit 13 n=1 Tax=Mycena maculata TaxID=230809 RepID=A0AAD7JYE5_9AGAR|nr:transcription initiation factor IID, 18kD subunit-domain-containing protein [Mycena maculata]
MSQSYGHYAPSGTQTPPASAPASAAYPYGAYATSYAPHTPYPQTPGAYPYQAAGAYQYGWNYSYNYAQQPQAAASQQRAHAPTPTPAATARTSTPNPPQRSSTFSSYTPSHLRESVATAATGGATGRGSRKQPSSVRGLFTKELKNLMYGFGDDRNPANDTVNVMEEILLEYITDVCQTAGAQTRRVRLSIEDLRRALSRPADAKKLARMEELLFMQEDIKRARSQFEPNDTSAHKEFE